MVGTTLSQVQPWPIAVCQKLEALKRWGSTRLPPWISGAVAVTTWALMW
jgi:hypothetical protein